MSAAETDPRMDAEPVRRFVDQWAESLAQVLESMTDRKPEVRWQTTTGPEVAGAEATDGSAEVELLWWEQPFQPEQGCEAWVAAPRGVWEQAGTLTLKAAGLETVETSEAKNTWLEIVGQSLGGMARALTAIAGHEVVCVTGAERAPGPKPTEWAAVSLGIDGSQLPTLWLALSTPLTALIATPPDAVPASAIPAAPVETPAPLQSRTMDLLLDVDLPVSISFGRTRLPLKDVLKLTTGSIVELNRNVNDPVEVLVNQCLIARGEVVVVEGNYGVRIQEIASRQERLRSIP